ncbi:MYND Zn-finger protein [Ceratobasidium sp. AG-Ba]|nr:MYND Zn-finger protein [Ceratobasidium sp. AG-Ba]
MVPNSRCQVCQKDAFFQCTGCYSVWYCSKNCQSSAWPIHHASCTPPAAGVPRFSPIESTTQVQALVLPANSSKPYITAVKVDARPELDGSMQWTPNFDQSLALGAVPASVVNFTGFGGSALRFPFHIFFRNTFLNDGSIANEAIRSLTRGGAAHPWAGNVVVFKYHGSRREKYRDFEITDIAVVAHFFLHYPNIS